MVGGASPRHVQRSAEASLSELATDYIDLYQLHRPDPATPIEETLGALDALVRAGKVRQIGCSYLSGAEFEASRRPAAKARLTPFTTCQNDYSLLCAASSATRAGDGAARGRVVPQARDDHAGDDEHASDSEQTLFHGTLW